MSRNHVSGLTKLCSVVMHAGGCAGGASVFILIINNILIQVSHGVRCYTDLDKTKSMSVECGLNTACVKIFKKSPGFDEDGQFIPLHKRGSDVTMFRGCFLVRLPDTCYESLSNRLTYCWCSNADLCNRGSQFQKYNSSILIILLLQYFLSNHTL